MIGIRVTVPVACWRKGMARELLETEVLPPPATCYGALLALVGETNRDVHVGSRVTAGILSQGEKCSILRTVWRVKDKRWPQGSGANARPDFQELIMQNDLVIWCDSSGEKQAQTLEGRVSSALSAPNDVVRFGGWCLGESTHLINDVWPLAGGKPPGVCNTFLLDSEGDLTLPVWVDHVGTAGTRYAVGRLRNVTEAPATGQLPTIGPD